MFQQKHHSHNNSSSLYSIFHDYEFLKKTLLAYSPDLMLSAGQKNVLKADASI